jgi:hypothetical protein
MIIDRGRLEHLEKIITSPTDSYGMTHITLVPCLYTEGVNNYLEKINLSLLVTAIVCIYLLYYLMTISTV